LTLHCLAADRAGRCQPARSAGGRSWKGRARPGNYRPPLPRRAQLGHPACLPARSLPWHASAGCYQGGRANVQVSACTATFSSSCTVTALVQQQDQAACSSRLTVHGQVAREGAPELGSLAPRPGWRCETAGWAWRGSAQPLRLPACACSGCLTIVYGCCPCAARCQRATSPLYCALQAFYIHSLRI